MSIYDTEVSSGGGSLRQLDREMSLQRLMRINLLKRLESYVEAFRNTLSKIVYKLETTLTQIDEFEKSGKTLLLEQTGEDNVLSNESSDLEYRKQQLKKLQEEVVDLDDTGVSITDLGLNDFRMDLVNYVKENGDMDKVPYGMHTVVTADEEKGIFPGVIFVLRNLNNEVNINSQNRLHPFYLVYINEDGEVIINHLDVEKTLDFLRALCKGKSKSIREAYEIFNRETKDGRNMEKYSLLLQDTVRSIIDVKEESDIDSLFSSGGTTALLDTVKGLEDFELISFVVIKGGVACV